MPARMSMQHAMRWCVVCTLSNDHAIFVKHANDALICGVQIVSTLTDRGERSWDFQTLRRPLKKSGKKMMSR
ncbi:hypothetical protein GXY_09614 [Novacetimonas hansenii ATCC 23769]|uniref:Uncharacterized protein n=1 Tax=Novacetimonas hansenii ATCC 23769 TaxID=714995 RepID=D5QFK3_NOVHA|nr:hypothetical protein GXY_09614 [Novacetimonas hansenii ATCC 23769]